MKKNSALFQMLCVILTLTLLTCTKQSENKISIPYEKYSLNNGLQVILHEDHSDPVISYAIMYHVGSSRERITKTGFAHLYEHMLFQGSENVPPGLFDKIIEASGGMNNGFTNRDVTTYFEIFPKNALEKILWLESDRMGFFINSVTPRNLAIQQNVVQNEKRQYEDNRPYGFTNYVLSKNLYPEEHPYNWQVIGEMEDLKNASLADVKSFYDNFYGPNNATLVLAGDFNPDSAKMLINKYFDEIKTHGQVNTRQAIIPKLEKTVKLYHEDNFANVPEFSMVWPVPEAYHKDAYALDYLVKILADGKKAPMYKILVKEKQLTAEVYATNYSDELAGEFTINIRANEGHDIKEIEAAVFDAFEKFEKDGISQNDIERVKAGIEKGFYQGLRSVLNKSLQLAYYNTFKNDPGFVAQDIENMKSVTAEDVKRVYNLYIKDKPYVATSFVPRNKTGMAAANSVIAKVNEETIEGASQVSIGLSSLDTIVKTPSLIARDKEPALLADPEVKIPTVWKASLKNGIEVYGIEHNELPLVNIQITFDGGFWQDDIQLPGVANLITDVMPQGTKSKTPEELEEEIKLLGSGINMYTANEEIVLTANMLSRNFEKTWSLITEMILEPRWDSLEFNLAKTRTLNYILQEEAQPTAVGVKYFNRILYGDQHILGFRSLGTKESVNKITLADLKNFYNANFSPTVTRIHIVGNITREQALNILKPLENKWTNEKPLRKVYQVNKENSDPKFYFVDIPGSKQSVILVGYLAITRDNPEYTLANFANYRFGGSFTSTINQILREQKGFTYGAHSNFNEQKAIAPFMISTLVRSDATLESLQIIKDNIEKYSNSITDEDVSYTRDCLLRSNALNFETLDALTGMLTTMSKYGFEDNYVEKENETIRNINLDQNRKIAATYFNPSRMVYLVVGDAATQVKPLNKLGLGTPVIIKQ